VAQARHFLDLQVLDSWQHLSMMSCHFPCKGGLEILVVRERTDSAKGVSPRTSRER
jgi:hypothetical protein